MLTKTQIDRAKPQSGKRYVIWDREIPGFGRRVSTSGRRNFIVSYRADAGAGESQGASATGQGAARR